MIVQPSLYNSIVESYIGFMIDCLYRHSGEKKKSKDFYVVFGENWYLSRSKPEYGKYFLFREGDQDFYNALLESLAKLKLSFDNLSVDEVKSATEAFFGKLLKLNFGDMTRRILEMKERFYEKLETEFRERELKLGGR